MNLRIPALAALAVVQVLATSCGGGGGGGGSAVFGALVSAIDEHANPNPAHKIATERLALAEPTAESVSQPSLVCIVPTHGCVSQSSNVNQFGVTADRVGVTGVGDSASSLASVTISVAGQVNMVLSAANADDEDIAGSTATFIRRSGNELSAAAVSVSFNDGSSGNTDWAAAGIWFHIPDTTSTNPAEWHFGVFANTDKLYAGMPATDLTGSARYEGTSVGYLVTETQVETVNEGPVVDFDFFSFDAEVVLEADFTNNRIGGSIRNIHDFSDHEDAEDFIVVLRDVTLTNDNFFQGLVKVRLEQGTTEYGGGNWGGQFFGDDAEGILGTYGGYFSDDTSDDTFIDLIAPDSDLIGVTFAGAFIAENEEE